MILYDYFISSASYRLRIALNLKGLSPDREFIHLRDGAQTDASFLALNPQGLVPALVDDSGHVHTQTLAIIEYLDETWPEPPLLPGDAAGRSRVRALAQLIACDIHPLNNLRVREYLTTVFGLEEERVIHEWSLHWLGLGFAALERRLADEPATGAFCHGDLPGLADCCLVPQVFNAERIDADISDYPEIKRIVKNCLDLEAFVAAHPSKQPDAE